MKGSSRLTGRFLLFVIFMMTALLLSYPLSANAEETRGGLPPHLIQTVSEQDVYEGMIALGMLENDVLKEEDCKAAYENVKDSVVRIQMGSAYGSGVVWKLLPDSIVIATNAHVLEYWDVKNSIVHFSQGYFTDAEIYRTFPEYDVGFLLIDNDNFNYEQLKTLRCVNVQNDFSFEKGASMFVVGAGETMEELEFYEGTMEEERKQIDLFDRELFYSHSFAKAGMSGGGTFDGKGNFIGMVAAGTLRGEIVSVPSEDIREAYRLAERSL